MLPLMVSPTPTERVRVMVGRVELFTEQQLSDVKALPDAQLQEKYGRFADAVKQFARQGPPKR